MNNITSTVHNLPETYDVMSNGNAYYMRIGENASQANRLSIEYNFILDAFDMEFLHCDECEADGGIFKTIDRFNGINADQIHSLYCKITSL